MIKTLLHTGVNHVYSLTVGVAMMGLTSLYQKLYSKIGFLQCASRKVRIPPWATLAPSSLAVIKPFLSGCRTTWTIFRWRTYSSSWTPRCSGKTEKNKHVSKSVFLWSTRGNVVTVAVTLTKTLWLQSQQEQLKTKPSSDGSVQTDTGGDFKADVLK